MEFEQAAHRQEHRTVSCSKHGDKREAFVCEHLLTGTKLGFLHEHEDRDNPYPDAWCSACERVRLEHGGVWNEENEALIRIKLVCGDCYEEIKAKNLLGTEENLSIQ
jgi:hypothetical protein